MDSLSTAPAPKPRILIVDDIEANVFSLKMLLKGFDAQLDTASCGPDALEMVAAHDYALLLLDVRMPGMDGYQLAEIIRSEPETASIPIIFVTAELGDTQSTFRGYEVGAVDYLIKPLAGPVLLGKVRTFLQLYSQRVQLQSLVRELEEEKMRVEESNRELERFCYHAAHDLKAPLGSVQRMLGLYRRKFSGEDPESNRVLDRVDAQLYHLTGVIDSLLELARIAPDPTDFEDVDLGELVKAVLADLQPRLDELQAEVEVIDLGLHVQAHPVLLRQVLTNLLNNALNYRREGVAPRIVVSSRHTDAGEEVSVQDNGQGFTDEEAKKIFEPFTRLVSQSEVSGNGFGLTIARRIMQAHRGQLRASGVPGEGAEFVLTFPT